MTPFGRRLSLRKMWIWDLYSELFTRKLRNEYGSYNIQ